jgi:NAD(P)H-flavin reductase
MHHVRAALTGLVDADGRHVVTCGKRGMIDALRFALVRRRIGKDDLGDAHTRARLQ